MKKSAIRRTPSKTTKKVKRARKRRSGSAVSARSIDSLVRSRIQSLELTVRSKGSRMKKKAPSQKILNEREARNLASYKANFWGMMLAGVIKEESANSTLEKKLFKEFNGLSSKQRKSKLEQLRQESRALDINR